MDDLWRDIRFALRSFVRAPTFTVVAVCTVALGIGANTAIFSVIDRVLLRPLPYDAPDALVTAWLDGSARSGSDREELSPLDLRDYGSEPGLFERLAGWSEWAPTFVGVGDVSVLTAAVVTHGMFSDVLRVQPVLGRTFLSEEDRPGGERTVVLSHRFWRERLAGDPSTLGRSLTLGDEPFTVIGVMPQTFRPPFVPEAALWTTAQLDPQRCGRGCPAVRGVGRLAEGVSIAAARGRAGALAQQLAEGYPLTHRGVGFSVFDLREDLVGTARSTLWTLLGAFGFILMIACVNVANLQLSRSVDRRPEFALREALGAGRFTIMRQLLAESLVLAVIGGVLGIGLAAWATDALVGLAPLSLPGLDQVSVDGRVLRFTAVLTLGTGVVFGLVPGLRRRGGVDQAFTVALRHPTGPSALRAALVASQVALAMVLLVGAGLLIRSFHELSTEDLGFRSEGVLTLRLDVPESRFSSPSAGAVYYEALIERLEAMPGVLTVGATTSLPLTGNDRDARFRVQDRALPEQASGFAWVRSVTDEYFYTMGQRLVEGREFTDQDDAAASPVVIVNESLARRYLDYPRRNPVGDRITLGELASGTWRTIVGVAGDTRHFEMREGARPALYFPHAQLPSTALDVIIRAAEDPSALTADVRTAVAEHDAMLAPTRVIPMADLVGGALERDRFVTSLLTLFAALALVLSAVGLYGVVSYSVNRRMREMGVRLALGAGGEDIRRRVVRSALILTAPGIGLGVVGALALTGALEALLYDVPVTDPLTFASTVGLLSIVAVAASWIPATRAASVDPVAVLREE
jgi:predicted permease